MNKKIEWLDEEDLKRVELDEPICPSCSNPLALFWEAENLHRYFRCEAGHCNNRMIYLKINDNKYFGVGSPWIDPEAV